MTARARSGFFNGALDDVDADLLVASQLQGLQGGQAAQERHAAAGDDAFFHRRAGGVQGVFDAGFLFLHLGLGRGADIDDGHAAGQLGQAFLQLLAVVVGGGFLDLAADLIDTALDLGGLAAAFDDGGVLLVNDNAVRKAGRRQDSPARSGVPDFALLAQVGERSAGVGSILRI